ncbi:MAG: hypothetical protein WBD57_10360 [Candidatus Cybelea sp.]
MRARFSDHRAAVRVAGQNCAFRLLVKDHFRSCDVTFERYGGILDDAYVESVTFEKVIDAHPSGAVHKTSVDEYDVVKTVSHVKTSWRGWIQ